MSYPLVSVCLASYNHARFLPAALDSILAQTYPNVEIIVVDDGSTDGSLQILEEYAARSAAPIRLYAHPGGTNQGISATVNLAASKAAGKYWCSAASDDVMYPDRLEVQVGFLEDHPEFGFACGQAHLINEDGAAIPGTIGKDLSGENDVVASLIMHNSIVAPTVMMRTACFDQIGLFDLSLVFSDWHYWILLANQYQLGFINQPVVKYRLHTYNTSVGIAPELSNQRLLAVLERIDHDALSIGGLIAEPRIRALVKLQRAEFQFLLGEKCAAQILLNSAFRTDPTLRNDVEFFAEWLNYRNQAFSLWTLKRLPYMVERPLRWACNNQLVLTFAKLLFLRRMKSRFNKLFQRSCRNLRVHDRS